MNKGKKKCMFLKSIRRSIAKKFGLNYNPAECTHTGDCAGTCPTCDAEMIDLQRQLDANKVTLTNQHLEPIILDEPMPFEDDVQLGGYPADDMPFEDSNDDISPDLLRGDKDFLVNIDKIGGMPAPPYIDKKKDKI